MDGQKSENKKFDDSIELLKTQNDILENVIENILFEIENSFWRNQMKSDSNNQNEINQVDFIFSNVMTIVGLFLQIDKRENATKLIERLENIKLTENRDAQNFFKNAFVQLKNAINNSIPKNDILALINYMIQWRKK